MLIPIQLAVLGVLRDFTFAQFASLVCEVDPKFYGCKMELGSLQVGNSPPIGSSVISLLKVCQQSITQVRMDWRHWRDREREREIEINGNPWCHCKDLFQIPALTQIISVYNRAIQSSGFLEELFFCRLVFLARRDEALRSICRICSVPFLSVLIPRMCIQRQVTVGDILNRVHDPWQPCGVVGLWIQFGWHFARSSRILTSRLFMVYVCAKTILLLQYTAYTEYDR